MFNNSKHTDHTFDTLTDSDSSYDDEESNQDYLSPKILQIYELDKYEEQFHNKIIIQTSKIANFITDSFSSKIKRVL